jgi:hypothetical protein
MMAARMTIEEHVMRAIQQGLQARLAHDSRGVQGVAFFGSHSSLAGEFIPFSDLNYNSERGYFRVSAFPNLPRECSNEEGPEILHYSPDMSARETLDFIVEMAGMITTLGPLAGLADLTENTIQDFRIGYEIAQQAVIRRIDGRTLLSATSTEPAMYTLHESKNCYVFVSIEPAVPETAFLEVEGNRDEEGIRGLLLSQGYKLGVQHNQAIAWFTSTALNRVHWIGSEISYTQRISNKQMRNKEAIRKLAMLCMAQKPIE